MKWSSGISPQTLIFFKIILAILGSLYVHICFTICLSISTKKLADAMIGIVRNQIKFRRTDILIACILTHEHSTSLQLLMPSLISLSNVSVKVLYSLVVKFNP